MKPNTIELFPDGRIGCYEMPERPKHTHGLAYDIIDGLNNWYELAIEAAKRDAVYFKQGTYHEALKIITGSCYGGLIKGKSYSIPDGYLISVRHPLDNSGPYAILVPKEKAEEFDRFMVCAPAIKKRDPDKLAKKIAQMKEKKERGAGNDYPVVAQPEPPKQQSIEETREVLRWIDPSRRERKIHRCEFCGTDVSTPYKGVHDETELISGIPVKCRNNGRLNMDIAFPDLISKLNIDKPKENIKWFVEDPETHLWWTGYKWTNDPHEAFGCDLKNTAERYARFQKIKNYIITEHQFG